MVTHENGPSENAEPFWSVTWKPLAVAVAVYLGIAFGYSAFFGFNPSCFLNVGTAFPWADEEHFAAGTVKYSRLPGYDACDYYVVALDPLMLKEDTAPTYKNLEARYGIHKQGRYQRFVYPLLINLLTFDNPQYFPHAMLLINFISMVGVALLLMKLLARRGASPWLSLVFVLSGGMLLAFWLDLQMYLCFFLIVSALYYYESERIHLSALLFAMALVTWECALFFAGPVGLWELLHRRWRRVFCFLLVPLPVIASQIYFARKIGQRVLYGSFVVFDPPFLGIARSLVERMRLDPGEGMVHFARGLLVLPVLALLVAMLALACWKCRGRERGPYDFMLLVQLLFFVVQDKRVLDTFSNAMRVNVGVFLALVLSYRDRKDRASPWLFAGGVCLAVLALARIFSTVTEPYVLIGGG